MILKTTKSMSLHEKRATNTFCIPSNSVKLYTFLKPTHSPICGNKIKSIYQGNFLAEKIRLKLPWELVLIFFFYLRKHLLNVELSQIQPEYLQNIKRILSFTPRKWVLASKTINKWVLVATVTHLGSKWLCMAIMLSFPSKPVKQHIFLKLTTHSVWSKRSKTHESEK